MDRLTAAWARLKENERFTSIRNYLPPLNFITVHYTYFIFTCLLFSLIFWGTSEPGKSISYTDSLFLVISAMTEAGLNTVNLSQMTLFQQLLLWILIVMGSSILVSISTVLIRKRVFEQRFQGVVKRQKEMRRLRRRESANLGSRSLSRGQQRGVSPVLEKLRQPSGIRNPEQEQVDADVDGPGEHHLGLGKLGRRAEGQGENPKVENLESQGTDSGAVVGSGKTEYATEPEQALQSRTLSRRASGPETDRILPVLQYAPSPAGEHPRILNFVGVGAHPNSTSTSAYKPNASGLTHRGTRNVDQGTIDDDDLDHAQYPSYLTRHTTGRNAQFYGLTRAERDHLGGVEYRAITLLAWVVPAYFVLWQLLGCVGLGAYMAYNRPNVSRENGINPWWLGIFNGASAFNNSGMSLLDANMIPFQTSVYTLFTMGLLILAGNTAYPLFLRLILWTMLKLLCLIYPSPEAHTQHKATLRFILAYPRRVYTNLFPSTATWWLFFVLILLNGIDWVAFELLNINNPNTQAIPANYRVLDGLFQALAVRSGGFYVIAITQLRIGLQVLYVIMMYISVYPVVITMRHSNVYEERSLGIYAEDFDTSASSSENGDAEAGHGHGHANDGPKLGTLRGKFRRTLTLTIDNLSTPFTSRPVGSPNGRSSSSSRAGEGKEFVRQQIHGQLAHDLWWLVLAILFIACIEGSKFNADPTTFSVFNIIFEVVSGYGCVGISTGLPDQAYSFSGAWHKSSKLILCAVMLRGRHRGLPVALDRAVRLPDENSWSEEADREIRRTFSGRRGSVGEGFVLGRAGER